MTGGDERAATHTLVMLIADNPAALHALRTLLLALGRETAAAIVAGVGPPSGQPRPA